jgi:signal transduction histidine kinase
LRGHCEQLIRRLPVGSDTQVQARVIGDEVERLITIVEKLLLLSRADANSIKPHMQPLNLSETLEQMIGDSDPAQSGLQVRAQIAPGIVWHCDRSLVLQMLHNLYANAINYNRPGGWVGITLSRQGDSLSLTIENPTAQVSDELLERAFERFYRADAAHGRAIDPAHQQLGQFAQGMQQVTESPVHGQQRVGLAVLQGLANQACKAAQTATCAKGTA